MQNLIEEGKKESSDLLNKSFGNDEILKTEVWDMDQTPSKGDVPYIIRFLNEEDSDLDLIKNYFSKYYAFKNRNLKVQTPQQFQTFIKWTEHLDNIERLDKLKNTPTKETSFENTEEDKIAEDSDVVIYKSNSQDRCIKYGKGYTFCISRPAGGNMYGSYRLAKKSTFYFIFFKKIPKSDDHHIMVLDKKEDGFEWTFADNNTKETDWDTITSMFPVLEKYKSLFVNDPLTTDEKNQILFLRSFREKQNLQKFIEVPTSYKIAFLKTGETLKDEIYSYLENNKLWDLINEYASVGPNLTNLQAQSIKNKGGSILKNYLKNREISIPLFFERRQYNYNILDIELDFVKQKHSEDYAKALEIVKNYLKDDIKDLRLWNLPFLLKLPHNIPKIFYGNLDVYKTNLESLEGSPEEVNGNFIFSENNLTSLKGGPKVVFGNFDCSKNNLTSLSGCPEEVYGNFSCSFNRLTSLEGGPKIVDNNFSCSRNTLTSLKGSPEEIRGDFDCSFNRLTSLEGGPKEVGQYFFCIYNDLTSLKGISEKIGKDFRSDQNIEEFSKEDVKNAMEESRKQNALKSESFKYFFYN